MNYSTQQSFSVSKGTLPSLEGRGLRGGDHILTLSHFFLRKKRLPAAKGAPPASRGRVLIKNHTNKAVCNGSFLFSFGEKGLNIVKFMLIGRVGTPVALGAAHPVGGLS
jgi:hypothetical protein